MMNTPWGQEHVVKKSKFTEEQIAFALKQIVADLSLDKAMLQAVVAKKLCCPRSAATWCRS